MKMVVFLYKQYIRHCQNRCNSNQIYPVRQRRIGNQIYHHQRNPQLQSHLNTTDNYVAHAQFVCPNLVGVLPVRLTKVLVEHDTMDNG